MCVTRELFGTTLAVVEVVGKESIPFRCLVEAGIRLGMMVGELG
jgi:hypothetical protein